LKRLLPGEYLNINTGELDLESPHP
jgi:hypothetical protein